MKALADEGGMPGQQRTIIYALRLGMASGRKFIERHDAARLAAARALEEWRTRIGIWDVAKRTDELRGYLERIDRVHKFRPSMVAQATARATAEAAKGIIAREKLDTARVAGIGTALCGHLARHGITTAADLSRAALSAVGGIGESRIVALLFWREAVAVKAEHAMRSAAHDDRAALADAAVDQHLRQLEQHIQRLIADLEKRVARVRKSVWLIDRALEDALIGQDQTAADLAYLELTKIARQNTMPAAAPPQPSKAKGKSAKKRAAKCCPSCGAPMVKRWGPPVNGKAALFLGCSSYPKCTGTQSVRRRNGLP